VTNIQRIEGPAGLIAHIPDLAGFTPSDALVLALFKGTRSVGTVRVDLQPLLKDTFAASFAVATRYFEIVAKEREAFEGVDGVVVIAYTDEELASDEETSTLLALVTGVSDALGLTGMATRDLILVGSNGYCSRRQDPGRAVLRPLLAVEVERIGTGPLPTDSIRTRTVEEARAAGEPNMVTIYPEGERA
jgi:hypothetical protein